MNNSLTEELIKESFLYMVMNLKPFKELQTVFPVISEKLIFSSITPPPFIYLK